MEAQTTTTFPTQEQSLEREKEEKQPLSMPSTLQDSEKDASKTLEQSITGEEHDYITGFKFVIVMVSVTLVVFLMLLDMSIIVTVRHASKMIYSRNKHLFVADDVCLSRPSLASRATFTLFLT